MLFLQLISYYLLTTVTPIQGASKTNLTVDIQNIKASTGKINVAIFRPCEKFPSCQPVEGKRIDAQNGKVQVTFEVEPGDYAVAVYHDVNNNGSLDKKLFGIPKEPYGFSNNYRPIVSGPNFNDCRITVGSSSKAIAIKLL